MSKESYARGFCKAAEAHGVDPTQLAKYAQFAIPRDNGQRPGPTRETAEYRDMLDRLDRDIQAYEDNQNANLSKNMAERIVGLRGPLSKIRLPARRRM